MGKIYVNPERKLGYLHPEIQGHFAEHLGRCIYGGIYVGEDSSIPHVNGMRKDVVEALRAIHVPVLRWPGGCFADEYHWKDGIGAKSGRKKMINTHWGGVVEDNSFGTHEFMELCRQLGCKPYVNGNLGSGTVQEMSEWVEYMTFPGTSPMSSLRRENGQEEPWTVDYFGVGNENWGCGGNMLPEYYAHEYRRYQTYVRNYTDHKIHKIACGPNGADYEWTDTLMRMASEFMDGLSLHYYTTPYEWERKTPATGFDKEEYYHTLNKTLQMEELVTRHSAIMDRYDPAKRVGLIVDEWGTWHQTEPGTNPGFLYQQNTMRDAVAAAVNLNIFNKHCDRVRMANIAQMVNVLQAVILTEGSRMLKTPTYHVFDLYQSHQGNELIESFAETETAGVNGAMVPVLQESVSVGRDGTVYLTVANLSADREEETEILFFGKKVSSAEGRILSGEMGDYNTFDEPEKVKCSKFSGFQKTERGIAAVLPPVSVTAFAVRLE